MHMDKDFIEDNLYQLIDQFIEKEINHVEFYFALLGKIHIRFMMEKIK